MAQVEDLIVRVVAEVQDAVAGIGKFEKELGDLIVQASRSGASLNDLAKAQQALTTAFNGARTDAARAQYAALSKEVEAAAAQLRTAATGGVDAFGKSTGRSAAIASEFGRVLSDLPYGIRGVANNLGQLVSLIGFGGGLGIALQGAIALLVAFEPQVRKAFGAGTESAKEAAKAAQELRSAYEDALNAVVNFDLVATRLAARTRGQLSALYTAFDNELKSARATLLALQQGAIRNPGQDFTALIAATQARVDEAESQLGVVAAQVRAAQLIARVNEVVAPLNLPTDRTPRTRTPRTPNPRTGEDVVGQLRRQQEGLTNIVNPAERAARAVQLLESALDSLRRLPEGRGTASYIPQLERELQIARNGVMDLDREVASGRAALQGLGEDVERYAVKWGKSLTTLQALARSTDFTDAAKNPGAYFRDFEKGLPDFSLTINDAALSSIQTAAELTNDLANATGRLLSLQDNFKDFGSAIVNALQDVVAQLIATAAKVLFLKAAFAFLDVLAPGLGTLASGAPIFGTGGKTGTVGGGFVQTGSYMRGNGDLVAVFRSRDVVASNRFGLMQEASTGLEGV